VFCYYTTRNSLNTNGLTDGILLLVICDYNYRRKFFHLSFHRYIPADYFGRYLSTEYLELKKRVVHWCGSFCWWFYRLNHREIQNGSYVRWRDRFTVRIADRLIEGFKPESPCSGVTYLPSEWPTEYIRRQKLIYDHLADPLLSYFSFFFPIPTLPYCKQPAPCPKKKNSLFSAQQVIFLEILWSQHPCSDLPTDFISFF